MPATTVFQLSPNRCRNFRNRSESLMVLRLVRGAEERSAGLRDGTAAAAASMTD